MSILTANQISKELVLDQVYVLYVYHLDSEDRHLLAGGTDDVRLFVSSRIDSSWSLWHLVDASSLVFGGRPITEMDSRSWIGHGHGLVAVLTYK